MAITLMTLRRFSFCQKRIILFEGCGISKD
jgi:hypothetical protein